MWMLWSTHDLRICRLLELFCFLTVSSVVGSSCLGATVHDMDSWHDFVKIISRWHMDRDTTSQVKVIIKATQNEAIYMLRRLLINVLWMDFRTCTSSMICSSMLPFWSGKAGKVKQSRQTLSPMWTTPTMRTYRKWCGSMLDDLLESSRSTTTINTLIVRQTNIHQFMHELWAHTKCFSQWNHFTCDIS